MEFCFEPLIAPSDEAEDFASERLYDYQLYQAFKLLNYGYDTYIAAAITDISVDSANYVKENLGVLNKVLYGIERSFKTHHSTAYRAMRIIGIRLIIDACESAKPEVIVKLIGFTDAVNIAAEEFRSRYERYFS